MTLSSSIQTYLDDFLSLGDKPAMIWHDKAFSYRDLLQEISGWRQRLQDLPGGLVIGIESDYCPATIALLFALIEKNAVLVPLDMSHADKNIKKIGIAQADYLFKDNGDGNFSIQKLDNAGEKNKLYDLLRQNPGLVLFTSGSSGEPKAALHDFTKLLAKFKVKRKTLVTINFLLFDHWGGLNTLFHILSNGGTVVILENRKADHVCEMIEKYKVELLPTSPTFLNMLLLSRAYERYSLQSLQVISYGSEPMPENVLKQVSRLFPWVNLQQTYGLIELGVMRSKSENNESLWVKIGGEGYETRIVDNILQIKSESAMLGYLNAESPVTDDGWFITGDQVESKDGYYRIHGRKSEIINVGGEKVFPQEVENVLLQIEGISDALVYAADNPLTGKVVGAKIKYEGPKSHEEIKKNIKIYCRSKLELFKVPVKIDFSDTGFESDRFKKSRANENKIQTKD